MDDLNDFSKMAAHTGNLSFDTTNAGAFGGDPSRLVRTAQTADWAIWQLQGMRSFTATTYALPNDKINYFSFASSPDGVTYTAVGPAITDHGGNWRRIDYSGNVPAGTNYLRITFPNSSKSASTPQLGQVTYSGTGGTASPSPSSSPSPSPTPKPTPSPSLSPSPSPTPSPSASPTPNPSAGPASFHVTAMDGGGGQTQETQYRVRLYNDSTSAQSDLKVRIFLNLSELSAAGLTPQDVATAKYWDQCGAVTIGPVTTWDAARSLYYLELSWGNYAIPAASSCEIQLSIHTANWQAVWNAANDPSYQGLNTSTYTTTTKLPVYRNNTLVYGTEP